MHYHSGMAQRAEGLAAKVERIRKSRQVTQAELAARCGISQGHYSKIAKEMIEPGARTRRALDGWLEIVGSDPTSGREQRIEELVATIARCSSELAGLIRSRRRGTIPPVSEGRAATD